MEFNVRWQRSSSFSASHVSLIPISVIFFFITARQFLRLIKSLGPKKATSPDKILVIVFKYIDPVSSLILTKLFNHYLNKKSFPSPGNLSDVFQVFKNAVERSPTSQCRPTSLLSVIRKPFEVVVNKNFVNHLRRNKLYNQYGFWSSRSTADIPTPISHRISEVIGNKYSSVAFDITKAFDKL